MSKVALLAVNLLFIGATWAQNPSAAIAVDVFGNRHPINPNVYGVAYATSAQLTDLNCPLNRSGGNLTTRYNWQINAYNHDADYYFESIAETSSTAGESGDTFITMSKSGGAQPMLTIPMIGWAAKLGANRAKLASFSIAKYGAQTGYDPYFPDAGNGVSQATGKNITGNDPTDANIATDSTFQQQWVQHIVSTWGNAQSGGLQYYLLDNEHSIWWSTHRDVQPTGQAMMQIRDKILDYAGKIRAIDANAKIVGPEEWGWEGYLYSGYDQQYASINGYSYFPDRANNGGWDYLPWLLNQLRLQTQSSGVKYLDVFSVHYYPQSGEFSGDTSAAAQMLRNRSTRSLWDPNYVDQSWISNVVQLIPRLKNWVNTYYYPGTPVGLTEYSWGADSYIGGATAQADVLGILGREDAGMAARWTAPDASTPTYKAIRMYRNYDGSKSTFGDTNVTANTANPDNVAAFAAQRSNDEALTVMVINKYLTGNTPITINLSNFSAAGSAQAWQLTSANAITRLADVAVSGNALSATLPPLSVTLFVVPATKQAPEVISVTPLNGIGSAQTFSASFSDPAGVSDLNAIYLLFNSGLTPSGACWVYYVRSSNSLYLVNDAGNGVQSGVIHPGSTSSPIANSQCSIANGGAITTSGNSMTLPVAITFNSAFGGPKSVYGYAVNNENAVSGWLNLGMWTPTLAQPPSVVSVNPINGSGTSKTFTATYSDNLGTGDLSAVYLLFNSTLNGSGACWAYYVPASNSLYLANDAGNGLQAGVIHPGTGGPSISNSQCTISNGGAATTSGSNLMLPIPVVFASGFIGAKNVYGLAANNEGMNSGWQTLGTWTPAAAPPPMVVSVTPINGSGSAPTFSATYSDSAGVADLSAVYLLFNSSINGMGACWVYYVPSSNSLYLGNDAGTGVQAGVIHPGTAGTPIANSQCAITNGGPVTTSGTSLTVPVSITFATGFTGTKNVYGLASNNEGMYSAWTTLGTWVTH